MKILNLIFLLLFSIFILKCKSFAQVKDKTATNTTTKPFVTGIKSAKVFTKIQAETGSEYKYLNGRTFIIKFFFEQMDIVFFAYNENKQKQQLEVKFDVGYNKGQEMDELKNNIRFLLGQYDFDTD